jgi:hypothetical protein
LTTLLAALAALLATLLATLLSGLSSWPLVGWLAALLGLSLWPTGLAFVLLLAFVLVLGIFALRDDQAAVGPTGAVKRDTQLRHRDGRHQGAGEQDIAKLLQLPDGFEWQGPLLKCEKRIVDARLAAPIAARLVPHCGRTLVTGSTASNEQFFRLAICPD